MAISGRPQVHKPRRVIAGAPPSGSTDFAFKFSKISANLQRFLVTDSQRLQQHGVSSEWPGWRLYYVETHKEQVGILKDTTIKIHASPAVCVVPLHCGFCITASLSNTHTCTHPHGHMHTLGHTLMHIHIHANGHTFNLNSVAVGVTNI